MNTLPPIMRDQRQIDAEHLKLLAIFHFIVAGFAILGILFLCAHYAIFHAMMTDPQMWKASPQGPSPAEFFALFRWFYVVFGLLLLAAGVLNLISGFCLRARKHRMFSIVVAGLNCLQMPFGTILGAFTLVVLVRGSVRELYDA